MQGLAHLLAVKKVKLRGIATQHAALKKYAKIRREFFRHPNPTSVTKTEWFREILVRFLFGHVGVESEGKV
jgi:hypothetical protein